MKRNITFLFAAVLLMVAIAQVGAQGLLKVKANKMTVQGSSSLHDWESQITKADIKGEFITNNMELTEVKNVEVKIPVESIKSTKGKMMDGKTYDAFKYEKFPFVVFTLTNARINAATGLIDATGTLAMAGASKTMDLQVKYKVLQNGNVQLILSKKFKMSEFKMDPPTAMMGSIKVGDEVTVNFDLEVNAKPIQ
jgi:polyisoprenoid-binding protein YceI